VATVPLGTGEKPEPLTLRAGFRVANRSTVPGRCPRGTPQDHSPVVVIFALSVCRRLLGCPEIAVSHFNCNSRSTPLHVPAASYSSYVRSTEDHPWGAFLGSASLPVQYAAACATSVSLSSTACLDCGPPRDWDGRDRPGDLSPSRISDAGSQTRKCNSAPRPSRKPEWCRGTVCCRIMARNLWDAGTKGKRTAAPSSSKSVP